MNCAFKQKLLVISALMILSSLVNAQTVIPQTGNVPVVFDQTTSDYINTTSLMAAGAKRPDTTESHPVLAPKHEYLKRFDSATEYLEWNVQLARAEDYHIISMLRTDAANQQFRLQVVGRSEAAAMLTFTVSAAGWQRHRSGSISIPGGTHTLKLTRLAPLSGDVAIRGLEFIQGTKADYDSRVVAFKSDTTTFNNYRYGLFFQYGPWGFAEDGTQKSIDAQAEDFNVAAFVNRVKETGAEYVMWSATWWTYEINAPIASVDTITGNSDSTSARDLIGKIAMALDAEGMGFYMYYHTGQDSHLTGGYNSEAWWVAQNWPTTFRESGVGDRSTFFNNWKKVVGEMGRGYGRLLDGWFFDDGTVMYHPGPFEELGKVVKAGNPDRLVSYNTYPGIPATDFQEISFGEVCHADLADVGSNGLYVRGSEAGLFGHCMDRMEGYWGIRYPGDRTGNPGYTSFTAFNTVVERSQRGVPSSFNLQMYEDGTISQDTVDVFTGMQKLLDALGCDTRINDGDPAISYTGTWNYSQGRDLLAGDFKADVHVTLNDGDFFEYTFRGTGVRIIGPADTGTGNIEVFIDNVSQGTINVTSTQYEPQNVYLSKTDLTAGSHTVKVVKRGGTYMQLDAIDYTPYSS